MKNYAERGGSLVLSTRAEGLGGKHPPRSAQFFTSYLATFNIANYRYYQRK